MFVPATKKKRPPRVYASDHTVWKTGIKIGTIDWFQWLLTIDSFSFVIGIDRLTVRRNCRKPLHWYAYRKHNGKLISRYVGMDKDLTHGTLVDIARYMKVVIPTDL
ncbi:hypothetical protein DSM106972_075200 [Dulcicalothrix desertica PCC 7102]|uniref:Uncharacterized protein n=1 Tax=Dulcicalothrix desertica PCC 7102 TaxID=232991 RepID=A0A3S1AGN1_9CYAN|nr:hypothetical protein [Dulcicalothrix desertica]RUT00392.1 hypothetical protein DSM106972_075200 [Dulcicalothrix desertica PCC 7102]TWH42499.1 hypothetical protein CAL7102_06161 [Dulcicalothrix desertica PCC 7102]